MKGPCTIHTHTNTTVKVLLQTKRKREAISIFALSFSVEWNLENFSWICRCSLSSNSMCVCVRLGLRDSQLSALCRFLSDVSGWGTVCQRNTCANLSAHGADWHSVCPEACGKSERERGIERQSVREIEHNDGGKRKDEFACGHPREAGYVFFFSHSQFKDNWPSIVLQGPVEFQHQHLVSSSIFE